MKLQEFKPFQRYRDKQMCLSTNDVVPSDIRDDLLTAWEVALLTKFVD